MVVLGAQAVAPGTWTAGDKWESNVPGILYHGLEEERASLLWMED